MSYLIAILAVIAAGAAAGLAWYPCCGTTDPCNACDEGTTPLNLSITIAGVADGVDCLCAPLNTTHVVPQSPALWGPCHYANDPFDLPITCPLQGTHYMRIEADLGPLIFGMVRVNVIAAYHGADEGKFTDYSSLPIDCSANRVIPLTEAMSPHCDFTAATCEIN